MELHQIRYFVTVVREGTFTRAAERLYINPDCGLLHLPGEVAFEKLAAMVEGTKLVRGEL